ncbi:cell wall metabolism sensor histidine kinase WalK [Leucobacter coleopterorum]|uniref:cell wall metabolism sensor histidine kinase WalK n=1 Tax=Leucobacter coleopterorum TaxID=2714933 RepID=UPI001FCA72A2|nr:cell wall metabolism sensor histidine kinase WalK [Leucobacter coleopterorum]
MLNSTLPLGQAAYDKGMDPTALVLASVGLGIVIGAGTATAIVSAKAAGRRRSAEMRPELPEIATSILDEVETFAVILDSSLTAVYANPTARQEQHISGEELRDPSFLQRVRNVMTTGMPDTHEPDPSDPGDTVRIHIVRLQRRFVVVLAEDIGEEQRVNAMRRDFIANVSHELKTPSQRSASSRRPCSKPLENPRLCAALQRVS